MQTLKEKKYYFDFASVLLSPRPASWNFAVMVHAPYPISPKTSVFLSISIIKNKIKTFDFLHYVFLLIQLIFIKSKIKIISLLPYP